MTSGQIPRRKLAALFTTLDLAGKSATGAATRNAGAHQTGALVLVSSGAFRGNQFPADLRLLRHAFSVRGERQNALSEGLRDARGGDF